MDEGELRNQIEALLFSAGRMMNPEELSRLTGYKKEDVAKLAKGLKEHYNNLNSSIMIIEEGDGWKMTVRESYLPLVRNINPHTELSKTVMETLAVIAWKSPVLQSTVIKLRTNKAYDHINELEELGFITREKYGRTFMLKLTQKFFEYFDLQDKKDIAKVFKDIQPIDAEDQLQVSEFDSEKAAEVAEKLKDEQSEGQKHDMEIVDEISEMEEKDKKSKK
ncbi:MAG: SMC-Scp complex subunit ScpB [Nanoarchaeota archaeon]